MQLVGLHSTTKQKMKSSGGVEISDNYRSREASEMFHIDKSAENTHFDGFLLHTIKTMDKVVRYGGNNQVDFFEHPTVIQCGDVRTINIYAAVSNVT